MFTANLFDADYKCGPFLMVPGILTPSGIGVEHGKYKIPNEKSVSVRQKQKMAEISLFPEELNPMAYFSISIGSTLMLNQHREHIPTSKNKFVKTKL